MKILVADIPEEGLDLAFGETLASLPFRLLSPVRATLHLEKVDTEVLVRGDLKASLELECSRCLTLFPKETDLAIDVVYHPVEDLKGGEKHEIADDELDMGFYQGDELDIDDLLREQILLSVPMKPLCSESCRGICPHCGGEMSTDTCTCSEKEIDPRLAVLEKLLENRKE